MNWLLIFIGVVILACVVMLCIVLKGFMDDFRRARQRHMDSC